MASTPAFVDSVTDQLDSSGEIRSRSMFGEYALYCNDKVVALICDDHLYMKITPISDHYLNDTHATSPYPGAKDALKVPAAKLQDTEWLNAFVRDTATALPAPKPKKQSRLRPTESACAP